MPVPEAAEASSSGQAAAGRLALDEPLAPAAIVSHASTDEPPSSVQGDAAYASLDHIPTGNSIGYDMPSGASGSPEQESCHSMADLRDMEPVPWTLSDSEQHSQPDASHTSQMVDSGGACMRSQDPLGLDDVDRSPLASRAASVIRLAWRRSLQPL
ncbi:hypothetical protein WJX74_011006 [Apatococcus lobatus]|uniref:Uncharacterized protein n=1 Tax=Apatococcus lobatus TaxID=904363 RepID=A0AAW1RXC0_9CHLO